MCPTFVDLIRYTDDMEAYRRGELEKPPAHPFAEPEPDPETSLVARVRSKLTPAQRRQLMRKPYRLKKGERRCAYSKARFRKPICREPECQEGQCRRLKALGLNDQRKPLPRAERPLCKRLTRKGLPRKARVVPGKRKCRVHGGCSNGPTTPEGKAKNASAMREGFMTHRDRIMADRSKRKVERDAAKRAAKRGESGPPAGPRQIGKPT